MNPLHRFDLYKVEVYTQLSEGHMYITNSGGNGNQGQKGADGKDEVDRIDAVWLCKSNKCLAKSNQE